MARKRRIVMTFLTITVFLVALGVGGLLLLSLTATPPDSLGVRHGRLSACPDSPNCVSTQADDQSHWIEPFYVAAASDTVRPIAVLSKIVLAMPRTTIVEETDTYLKAEFRSQLFRFCDDVEFLFERESGRINFRSASRVGHSDLGVNRTRMEAIRQKFQAAMAKL